MYNNKKQLAVIGIDIKMHMCEIVQKKLRIIVQYIFVSIIYVSLCLKFIQLLKVLQKPLYLTVLQIRSSSNTEQIHIFPSINNNQIPNHIEMTP